MDRAPQSPEAFDDGSMLLNGDCAARRPTINTKIRTWETKTKLKTLIRIKRASLSAQPTLCALPPQPEDHVGPPGEGFHKI